MNKNISVKRILLYTLSGLMLIIGIYMNLCIYEKNKLLMYPLIYAIMVLNVLCGITIASITELKKITYNLKKNIIALSILIFIFSVCISMFLSATWIKD